MKQCLTLRYPHGDVNKGYIYIYIYIYIYLLSVDVRCPYQPAFSIEICQGVNKIWIPKTHFVYQDVPKRLICVAFCSSLYVFGAVMVVGEAFRIVVTPYVFCLVWVDSSSSVLLTYYNAHTDNNSPMIVHSVQLIT